MGGPLAAGVVRRRVLIGVVLVAGLIGLMVGGMYAFQRSFIYHPSPGPLPPASDVLPGGRDVQLQTTDGLQLDAWYFAPREPKAWVLFAPGNGGHRGGRIPLARELTARGFAVLLLDYRGYGGNPGSPSEPGLALDARAARSYLVDELRVPPSKLLYFGESLGCGVVSELAVAHPPAGMLLRSPFVNLPEMAGVHYPWLPARLMLHDRFPVAQHVQGLDGVPITVVYGSNDGIVPPEQSVRVAEAARAVQVRVDDADHNDLELLDGPEVVEALVELASRAIG